MLGLGEDPGVVEGGQAGVEGIPHNQGEDGVDQVVDGHAKLDGQLTLKDKYILVYYATLC